jgi:hypothetical protein
VGIGIAGTFGIWKLGDMVGQELVKKYGAGWAPWASAGASLVSTVLLSMLGIKMTGKLSVPLLIGGGVASVANALASYHPPAAAGAPSLSLGRTLGLQLGDALTPGLNTGLNLHGAYLPRADFSGAYVPRAEMNSLQGTYLPRADFSGLRGYLPVGSTEGENPNVALKGDSSKLRSLMRDHMAKMGEGSGF